MEFIIGNISSYKLTAGNFRVLLKKFNVLEFVVWNYGQKLIIKLCNLTSPYRQNYEKENMQHMWLERQVVLYKVMQNLSIFSIWYHVMIPCGNVQHSCTHTLPQN